MVMRFPMAAVALLVASAAGAEPRVRVTFTITEPEFVRNLKDKRPALERKVVEDVVGLARESFGFVDWLAADDGAAPAPDAELKLTLLGEQRQEGWRTSLGFGASVGGRDLVLPELPSLLVYEFWANKPTHNPEALRNRLKDMLLPLFASDDDFRRRFQGAFLSQVPLSRQVMVRGAEERLLIVASWRSLRAGTESTLRAHFSSQLAAGALSEGQIRLSPEGPLTMAGVDDGVLCRIRQFTYPAVTVEGVAAWHPRIPDLLGPEALKSITVSMEDYKRAATTSGQLALEPR
jgi:hypothetical protein